MADGRKIYANINNEQDLITLLGSDIVKEFAAMDIAVEGLLLAKEDDPQLRALLQKHGIGLKHVPYSPTTFAARINVAIYKARRIRFFALSPRGSTLHAKSLIRYRDGEFTPVKYWFFRALGQPLRLIHFGEPLLRALHRASMPALPRLDAPTICLDYIHNAFHLELRSLNRALGKPYVAYVANLDQVTNYPVHFDIPDAIFVWGRFHASVLSGRFGIRPEKITPTGFCRSDSLVGISPRASRPVHAVYFCASIFSNDPDYADNLLHLVGALEGLGEPYVLTLKKHPGNETDIWDHYQRVIASLGPLRGRVALVANTWEKYNKLEKRALADKDFSYSDLRNLLSQATHVFSSTSTTTLEASLAGARSCFINLGRKLDGTFAFEHLKVLVDAGVIRMVTRPEEFAAILSDSGPGGLGPNDVVANVGSSSRAFAARAAALLFPDAPGASVRRDAEPVGSRREV